jgi:iron(III) transport system ATP-binding protein
VAAGRAVTPLGALAARGNGKGTAADGDCEVLVRPELVQLATDDGGDAVVTLREFRGHDVLYRVRLADGTDLWSQRPSNEVVPLGSRVRVRLEGGPVAVFR